MKCLQNLIQILKNFSMILHNIFMKEIYHIKVQKKILILAIPYMTLLFQNFTNQFTVFIQINKKYAASKIFLNNINKRNLQTFLSEQLQMEFGIKAFIAKFEYYNIYKIF